jgi:hypothetical protein
VLGSAAPMAVVGGCCPPVVPAAPAAMYPRLLWPQLSTNAWKLAVRERAATLNGSSQKLYCAGQTTIAAQH